MPYALVTGDTIAQVGPLPTVWFDGTRWWDFRDDATDPATLGWLPLVEEPRPADTSTTTWERADPALIDGVPTVGWAQRDKTAEELAADQAAANAQTIGGRMVSEDMPAMAAIIAQTNAAIRTDPSQEIKELARACRRLQRHVLQLLDGTE